MADRTVAVRLNLDTSGYRRGAAQAEQATSELAAAAAAAAAEQQGAFGRSAAGIRTSMGQATRAVGTFGQATQESTSVATAGLGRFEVAAREMPATLAGAVQSSTRSFGQIATSATAAANSVVAADTRMTEAGAAAARGTRLSLETRLALAEAVTAREAQMAAAAERAAAVQAAAAAEQAAAAERAAVATMSAYARMTAAVSSWAAATRASAVSGFGAMATAGERGEKAFGAVRTAGIALLAVFAAASVTAAKFEKSMSGVYAVADATAEQMKELRSAALEAGRDTSFSASQAADAEAELARAGVSVADITGGALKGSLGLAAAGQLDLAESAVISAQAMNTFGLRGQDVTHIADVLASGANKSAADVHGLGESLRMGGLLAHQTGLSLEDTVGVLSMFSDHALIGSDAGTSLKVMLQRLVPQSGEAYDIMQKLGFAAYDAQGNFIGLTALADMMKRSFGQLTPEARNAAMATIFGSDSVRSATILYEQGAAGVDRYRDAVNDQGAAERMAAVQMNNLSGDLEQLRGSLEVALIQGGTEANKVLRDMVQIITSVVNAYSSLPSWAQTSAIALAATGGAIALVAGGLMLALPRIAAFQASLMTLSTTMPRLATAARATTSFLTGPWGIGIAVAVAALGAFGAATGGAKKQTEQLTEAVKADGNAIGANTKAWVAHELEKKGVLKSAQSLKISTADLTEAILGNGEAAVRVRAQLAALKPEMDKIANTRPDDLPKGDFLRSTNYDNVSKALDSMSNSTNQAVESAKREATAASDAASGTKKLGAAATITAGDLADTRTEADKLKDSLDRLNGANIDAAQSSIRYQQSLQELRDTVKENGRSLDITTEKGRQVKGAFLGAAEAAMAHAEAVMKQTGSSEQAQIVLAHDVDALKATMKQAGFTADQIESLTAAYMRLPETKATTVTDPGALQTIKDLQDIKAKLDGVPPGKTITVRAPSADAIQDLQAIGYKVENLPDGKVRVTVPTNDAFDGVTRIQQMVNGITDKSIRVLVNGMVTLNGEYLHGGRGPGFANGGVVHAASGYTVPGYAPRRDVVPAMLSPGEGVLVPETVRRLGGAPAIDALNAWGRYNAPPPQLIPARALVGAGGGGSSHDNSRTTTVNLHGARMTEAEQAAGLLRLLDFYG